MAKTKKKKSLLPDHPDFPDKYARHISESWASTAEAMEQEDMDKCIVECEMTIESTEKDVADDSKLQALKEDIKYLQEGYKDVINAQKSKIKFLLYLMNSRGYNVSTDSNNSDDSTDVSGSDDS